MNSSLSPGLSRRQFLALTSAGLAASGLGRRLKASEPTASSAVRLLVSGGTITSPNAFLEPMQKAQKDFFGEGKKILLILHASLPDERDRQEKKLKACYAAIGYDCESLHHFEGKTALDKIDSAEAIFVSGGETFLLLSILQKTGQLALLRRRVLEGTPYHGTSAGSNIAGPCIGCTNDFPITEVADLKGLNLFPALINPHHPISTDSEFSGRVNKIKGYLRYNVSQSVLGIANGSAAVLEGNCVRIVHGPSFLYQSQAMTPLLEGPVPQLAAGQPT